MTDNTNVDELKDALAQVLHLNRGIPFSAVIKALANHIVIPVNRDLIEDVALIAKLDKAIRLCASWLKEKPIERPRPNEVGNDVESFVLDALKDVGFRAERPRSGTGRGKATGYPDLLFFDDSGRPSYLECKTFSDDTKDTTMRSFYLSPSADFKIGMDARHILVSFEMIRTPINGSSNSKFTPSSYKIVDLCNLNCDLKLEFNSDNRRLYDGTLVLASGPC